MSTGPISTPPIANTDPVSRLTRASAKIQRFKLLLRKHWWAILLFACIGVFYQAWKVQGMPVTYFSTARLIVKPKININREIYSENPTFFLANQMDVIYSSALKKRTIEILDYSHENIEKFPVQINASGARDSTTINIRATSESEKYCKAYLEALLEAYFQYRKDQKQETSEDHLDAITAQILEIDRKIDEASRTLQEFESQNDVIVLEQGQNTQAQYLKRLEQKKKQLGTELELLRRLSLDEIVDKKQNDNSLESAQGSFTELRSANVVQEYISTRQSLGILQLKRADLLKVKKPAHQDVIEIERQIRYQKEIINLHKQASLDRIVRQKNMIQVEIETLDKEIKEWTGKALETSGKLSEHKRLRNKLNRYDEDRQTYMAKLETIDQSMNLSQDPIGILEKPSPPQTSSKDKIGPLISGGMGGAIIGLLLLLVIDKLDDRMNTISEFQTNFQEEILGHIPQIPVKRNQTLALLQPDDARHPYAEAYRNLRSSLLFKQWQKGPPKTILVTSAVPSEGKTTVSGNISTTIALSGARVLLVDGDLRKGRLHHLLHKEGKPGLSEYLKGTVPWKKAVVPTAIPNLFFLPRGETQTNTSELFLSSYTQELLDETQKEFDYVIFDAAPVLVADDTTSLAPKVDATLYVVRLSSTPARLVAKSLELLYSRQVPIAGTILNCANAKVQEYPYYNYANYYKPQPLEAPVKNRGKKA